MGVRRAVEMVLDAPNKHENPICTFGPLIHNPQVLNLLEEKGISILDEVPDHGSGTVLIRAHGVPLDTKENLKKAGFKVMYKPSSGNMHDKDAQRSLLETKNTLKSSVF